MDPCTCLKLGADNTEAKAIMQVKRSVVVPMRGSDAKNPTAPAPAATHTARPRRCAHWVCLSSAGISIIPVPAPFKNISMHVVQFPGIGCFTSCCMGGTATITDMLCVIIHCTFIAMPIPGGPGPARVFTLRLSRQAVSV